MKKFIAMFAALSMVASMGIASVFAAEPTDLTISCDVQELDAADYEDVFGDPAGDNVGYTLTFAIEGLADDLLWTQSGSGSSRKYNGRSIDAAALTLISDIDNSNFVNAFANTDDAAFGTENDIISSTFDGLTMENAGARMIPKTKSTAFDGSDYVILYVAIPKGVEMNLTPQGTIKINNWENASSFASSDIYSNETGTNLVFSPAVITLGGSVETTYTYTFKNADGTADISVLSDLTAGAAVTAPTAPTVADKKFDHWSDEIGGAAVVVDTTASADKTYYAVYVDDFETVAPSTAQTAKVAEPGATTYMDYDNNPVTLTKNYAIARFQTGIDGSKKYQIHASSASTATVKDFDVNFGLLEVSGTANFVAIIKGAPKDTVMELRVK